MRVRSRCQPQYVGVADLELNVAQLHAITRCRALTTPILVDIQPVCRPSRDKVLEQHVPDITRATIGFDHEYLVATISINISVNDVLDGGVSSERANRRAARLVAPDTLNKDIGGGRLDGDAFVPVGDFDVVDPVVRSWVEEQGYS